MTLSHYLSSISLSLSHSLSFFYLTHTFRATISFYLPRGIVTIVSMFFMHIFAIYEASICAFFYDIMKFHDVKARKCHPQSISEVCMPRRCKPSGFSVNFVLFSWRLSAVIFSSRLYFISDSYQPQQQQEEECFNQKFFQYFLHPLSAQTYIRESESK